MVRWTNCATTSAITSREVHNLRALSTQALIGWFEVPFKIVQETPIEVVINPCGSAVRSEKRIWNNGDGRMRLYTVGSGATITLEREPEDRVESSIDDYFGSAYSRMPLF